MMPAVQQPDLFMARPVYPEDIPPDVCQLFERFALEVMARGFTRYSADCLLHRIRWHEQVDQGNREFKINDHFSAPLARWFLSRHPEAPKFFELRASKHD